MLVIDASMLTAPKEVTFYDPPLDVPGLAWEDKRVCVAANRLGLIILEIDEVLLPQPRRRGWHQLQQHGCSDQIG